MLDKMLITQQKLSLVTVKYVPHKLVMLLLILLLSHFSRVRLCVTPWTSDSLLKKKKIKCIIDETLV